MKTWFTADTHFSHAGVIRMCARPFFSTEEMNALLVESWNAVVSPKDEVWHLGDFAMGASPERCAEIFRRLRGRKRLVRGNHDRRRVLELAWESQHDRVHVTVEGHRLVLDHYPMRAWSGSFRGAIHLHGHTHGTLPGTSQSCDVGVDSWGYRPVGLDDILTRLAATPELPEERRRAAEYDAEEGDDAE